MAESVQDEQALASVDGEAWAPWKARIAAAKKRREEHIGEWQENVETRRGGRVSGESASTFNARAASSAQVSVNQDWPLTKAKIAQLYSQTPEIRLTPRFPEFAQALQPFSRELNDTISDASVGTTVEEVLADVVNASGIGGALISCEKRTEARVDPVTQQSVALPVDIQYLVSRISPADLLVPSDFTGSNYDHARWLGHDGRLTWAQAQAEFGLDEAVKDQVLGTDRRANGTTTSLNTDSTKFRDTDVVSFQQIFYWRHFYHADETNFKALQRIVFVDGLDEPVVNEPYQGQKRTEDGRLLGVRRNPIQILTLTYVSDDSLPPSDSTIGRFQVDELEASRDAMVQQRRHSIPIRWGDTNRISSNARAKLEQGDYQGFIWTNGPGDRAVGEVARASFPQERFEFDRIIKNDLAEIWQVGTNQAGAFASGERSASEARIIQQNFTTRVGQERDKVTRFVLGIAEVLAGHLALYGTFDLPDQIGVDREALATGFTYSVRVDSTVRMDAQQRIEQLERVINFLAQSPYADVKPVVEEYIELNNIDPSKVVRDPQPKPPEPLKISISNAADANDPMFVAFAMRTQQAPTPDEVTAAQKLIASVRMVEMPPPAGTEANTAAPRADIVNADWQAAPRLDKRDQDGGM